MHAGARERRDRNAAGADLTVIPAPDALDERTLRRLLDAGRALVGDLDRDTVLERLLETAAEVTGARYAALGILDASREGLERFVTRGAGEDVRAAIGAPPRGRGVLGALITDPRPLRLDSVRDDPRSFGFPPGHPPMETFLGVPILVGERAWGNLYLAEKAGREAFTQGDEDAVVVLAAWAGVAIANARLFSDSERRRGGARGHDRDRPSRGRRDGAQRRARADRRARAGAARRTRRGDPAA